MRIHPAVLRIIVFVVLARSCSFAEAQKIIKRVAIQSSMDSLGRGSKTTVVIKRKRGKYLSSGRPVSAVQVQSLAAALSAAPLTQPDMTNLGINYEWVTSKVESQRPPAGYWAPEMTAGQKKLFQKSFTNPNLVANILPSIGLSIRLDYSLSVR